MKVTRCNIHMLSQAVMKRGELNPKPEQIYISSKRPDLEVQLQQWWQIFRMRTLDRRQGRRVGVRPLQSLLKSLEIMIKLLIKVKLVGFERIKNLNDRVRDRWMLDWQMNFNLNCIRMFGWQDVMYCYVCIVMCGITMQHGIIIQFNINNMLMTNLGITMMVVTTHPLTVTMLTRPTTENKPQKPTQQNFSSSMFLASLSHLVSQRRVPTTG